MAGIGLVLNIEVGIGMGARGAPRQVVSHAPLDVIECGLMNEGWVAPGLLVLPDWAHGDTATRRA